MVDAEKQPTPVKDKVVACATEIGRTILSGRTPLRICLFGSRVAGTHDHRSDFDIGIDAGEPLPADVITRVKERFDALDILQQVDVVDLRAADERFVRAATANQEVIFER